MGVPQLLQLFGTLKKAWLPITRGVALYATLIVTMSSCLKPLLPIVLQLGVTSRQIASSPTFEPVTSAFARYVSVLGGEGQVAALLPTTKHAKPKNRTNDEAPRCDTAARLP